MGDIVDLSPRPHSEAMQTYLDSKIESHHEFLNEILSMMKDTKQQTKEDEEPDNFSYGKLLRYLKEGTTESEIVNLCAAAVWLLSEERSERDDSEE